MSDTPPRSDDADETIDEESEVDEASYESFPASDAPGWTGTYAAGGSGSAEEPGDTEGDEEE